MDKLQHVVCSTLFRLINPPCCLLVYTLSNMDTNSTVPRSRAKLPFCALIGVDKENKSRVICQALLPNEQAASYEFAITHLIKVCGGLHPKVQYEWPITNLK